MLAPKLTITPSEYVMMQLYVRGEFKQSATSRRDREIAKAEVDEILKLNNISVAAPNNFLTQSMNSSFKSTLPEQVDVVITPTDVGAKPELTENKRWESGNYYAGEAIPDQTPE